MQYRSWAGGEISFCPSLQNTDFVPYYSFFTDYNEKFDMHSNFNKNLTKPVSTGSLICSDRDKIIVRQGKEIGSIFEPGKIRKDETSPGPTTAFMDAKFIGGFPQTTGRTAETICLVNH